MSDPNAMEVDPESAPAQNTPNEVTVTVEKTTVITTEDAPGLGFPQPMEVDSAPALRSDESPDSDGQPALIQEIQTENVITTVIPHEAAEPDVFSLPAELIPSISTSPHEPTASNSNELDVFQNHDSPSSFPTNGDIPSTSCESPTPVIATVTQPPPAPVSAALDAQSVHRPTSPARMVRTGYIYDPLMMLHCQEGYTPTGDHVMDTVAHGHPEEPMRIKRIFARLAENGLIKRMKRLDFAQVSLDQVLLVHTEDHWNKVQGTESTSFSIQL